jgi:Leucine-rich repeat (LRR) protein
MPKLLKLNLEFNDIREIKRGTFFVSYLLYLNLNYNKIRRLENDTFRWLSGLNILSLEGNNLQYIHPQTFLYFINLQNLLLSKNPELDVPNKDIFIASASLIKLGMSGCGISSVSVETFALFTRLRWLDLSYNKLTTVQMSITKDMLDTLEQYRRLRELTINFQERKFLRKLEHLNLNYNKIRHLENDTFSGLVNLKNLSLEGNELRDIDPQALTGLPNLQRLILSQNPNLQIPNDSNFIKSYSLKELHISDCNIRSVSVKTFSKLSALEWLDLSNNKLRKLNINILKMLPELIELNLESNDIRIITPGTFNVSNLENLNLKYNKILRMENDTFSGLFKLKYLCLKGNNLQYIHPHTFSGLPKLKRLNLSKNPELKVPNSLQTINPFSLQRLVVSGFNISSVSVEFW